MSFNEMWLGRISFRPFSRPWGNREGLASAIIEALGIEEVQLEKRASGTRIRAHLCHGTGFTVLLVSCMKILRTRSSFCTPRNNVQNHAERRNFDVSTSSCLSWTRRFGLTSSLQYLLYIPLNLHPYTVFLIRNILLSVSFRFHLIGE